MTARPAILITGAAKRVGAGLARSLAAAGYDIALHYRISGTEAAQLQKEIEATGARCVLFPEDLSDIAALPAFMSKVQQVLPNCVALINNAAVFERAPFMDTDEALFDRQFNTNFKAPFFLTQAFAKTFGKGSVINMLDTNISSTQPSHFAYMLSKKALADFTLMAARALGPDIRVNGLCPGPLLAANARDEAYMRKLEQILPLQSNPQLEECAQTVLWLLGQAHITGQLVYIDGGQHVL